MRIKTVITTDGINAVSFDGYTQHYYWIKNLGDSTLYVSARPNPMAGADDVSELSARAVTSIETDEGKIYILGAGKVEVHNTDSKLCPFEIPGTGSGGGGSTITVDSSLSELSTNPVQNKIVKTALDDKANLSNIVNDNLLINPDFKINQRGVSGTFSETGKYFVDRWRLESGTVTVNSDGSLTLNGTIAQVFENAVGVNVTASSDGGAASYDNNTKTFTLTGTNEVIRWAKLEYGDIATAFISPDHATELMKCQRYYQKWVNYVALPMYVNAVTVPPFTVEMRKVPSYSIVMSTLTGDPISVERVTLDRTHIVNINIPQTTISDNPGRGYYVSVAFDAEIY